MKKIIVCLACLFLYCGVAESAGSWAITQTGSNPGSGTRWVQYTGTADAANGSLPALTVTGFYDFYLYSVETWPGSTAPTDNTDFTLLDAVTGEDLLGGNGTDSIDATTPKTILPKSTAMGLNFYHMVKGNMTLNVTNNAVNSAIVNIRITGAK